VRVIAITQQIDLSGPVGHLIASLLFGIAEIELQHVKEREPARRRPPLFRDPRRGAAYRCGVVGHAGAAAPGMHGLPSPTRIGRQ